MHCYFKTSAGPHLVTLLSVVLMYSGLTKLYLSTPLPIMAVYGAGVEVLYLVAEFEFLTGLSLFWFRNSPKALVATAIMYGFLAVVALTISLQLRGSCNCLAGVSVSASNMAALDSTAMLACIGIYLASTRNEPLRELEASATS